MRPFNFQPDQTRFQRGSTSFPVSRQETTRLVSLAVPLAGVALVNMGMSITDTVMMGWIGPNALASGAIVSDLYSIVFYFLAGVISSVAPIAARAFGSGSGADLKRACGSGFLAAIVMAVPAFVLVWNAAEIANLIGADPVLLEEGERYAHSMAFTIVPMLLVAVWRNFFGAVGRPKVFLVATASALPVNAIGNGVFMFGWGGFPELGVMGAGVSSALVALLLMLGLSLFALRSREFSEIFSDWTGDDIRFSEVVEIFRIGLPIGFYTLGEVGAFLVATVVISVFGADALSAHAIALRFAGLIYAIPAGISQAATIRVSQAIGRRAVDGFRMATASSMALGGVMGVLIFIGLFLGSDIVPALFVGPEHASVLAMASQLICILAVLHIVQGFAGAATGVLRGLKDTRVPMVLSLAGYWLVGAGVAGYAAFVMEMGATGVWFGLASGVAANAVFMNVRLFGQRGVMAYGVAQASNG